jgi:outer membrane lipoprotein-sorting protein
MSQASRLTGGLRWGVPAGAVGAVAVGSVIASAQAAPTLPARTPAQLLAAIARGAALPSALSGTVVETASLGLPDLPSSSSPTSVFSLLSGTHTLNVWYGGPGKVRIAIPVPLGETDLRQDGRQVWLWDSSSNSATHLVLPAATGGPAAGGRTAAQGAPAGIAVTPQQAARQVLALVGPTTSVSVQPSVTVAGQPAYQLAIAPKSASSLIGQVRIALDANGYLPLQVQVFARGATSPAYQVGYTSISFAAPAASNFTFTPPPGARVQTVAPTVPQRAWAGPRGGPRGTPRPGSDAAGPTMLGTGWLSVAVLPGPAASRLAAGADGPAAGGAADSGEAQAVLGALLASARPVHGSWGSGRLLTTRLVNVLITSSGRVLAGAVTPSVLYADAAKAT